MKELVATARNLYYTRNEDGTFEPSIEIILVVSEPVYTAKIDDNTVKLTQRRENETIRFSCSPASLGLLLKAALDVIQEIEARQPESERQSEDGEVGE